MSGLFGKLWNLLRYKKSKIPLTFSLGDRPPHNASDESGGKREGTEHLVMDLAQNLARLKSAFVSPLNMDLVVREFSLTRPAVNAAVVHLDGMTDRQIITSSILQPLMYLSSVGSPPPDKISPLEQVEKALLPGGQIKRLNTLPECVNEILAGSTVLLLDLTATAVGIETKGFEHRTLDTPRSEQVVRGPHEGLVETLRVNTAAIRRRLRSPSLVTELMTAGVRSRTDVALMYLHDVANPKLVAEVKRRVKDISEKVSYVDDSGVLEQLIEDHPHALVPQTLSTERPDRCAAFLNEGYVVVMTGTSPYALIVPATFTMFIHSPEDYYLRWPFGSFIRLVRFLAGFISLLLPAFYVATVNYHQEMIPTDLLLAMAAARENVPFPAIVEVLIMEGSFELIREAGVRIPSVMGPTIGIVGALILGQAAVAASIVSPILIIIVAVTALSSFAIPNFSAAFTLRVLRFGFIVLASLLGFYGIAAGLLALAIHLVSLKSFGVPYMSPIAPYRPGNADRINRPGVFDKPSRPWFIRPLDMLRQRGPFRTWSPEANTDGEKDDAKK